MANFATGKYLVELTGQQGFSETSTGSAQFFMKFLVQYRWDFARGEWVECDVAERTYYRVLTEKTAEYAAEDFRSLGFDGDKFSQLDPRHPQKHIFSGQIEMTLAIEQYNGKPKEKWNVVRGGSGGREEKVIEPTAMKKLDLLFGAALKAVPPAAPVQRPAPPAARPAPLVSQPRQRTQTPPENIDQATGYAKEPPNRREPIDNGITDDDLPF
jgi:hypothetical protein